MHSVIGKHVRELDAAMVAAWAAGYHELTVDLGTGDGHFVRHLARQCPARAVIGVDTCQANMRQVSRRAPANALFVVADARALPSELHRLATGVSINFPWGSLLRGLLAGHTGFLTGLHAVGSAGLTLDIRLNAGALIEAGWGLEAGSERVANVLHRTGFAVSPPQAVGPNQLRAYPTTWAKRLAFGRDPRSIEISAVLT